MQLLEDRKDQYVVLTDSGDVLTLTKSPYHEVKIKGFSGNRIFYKFDADNEISETYDDGIFNCRQGSAIMQLDKRDEIAAAIKEHRATGSIEPYVSLFNKALYDINRLYLVKHVLADFRDRLKITENAIYVDGVFYVNKYAAAYSKNNNGSYSYLCIVVKAGAIDAAGIVKTPLGNFEIDKTGLEIVAKVLFLLNPNPRDDVFMRQLSERAKEHVRKISGDLDVKLW